MSTQNNSKSLWIPSRNAEKLKMRFESLATKAKKNGLPVPTFTATGEKKTFKYQINSVSAPTELWYKPNVLSIEAERYEFHGEMPVYSGWEFLAGISHGAYTDPTSKEGKKYSNIVMGELFLDDERRELLRQQKEILNLNECPPNCEHCELSRKRNQTFILHKKDTGEVKQVGSTCIDDFLGEKTLSKVLWFYEIDRLLSEDHNQNYMEEYFSHGLKGEYPVELELFVAVASMMTDQYGFVSSKELDSTATKVKYQFKEPEKAVEVLVDAFKNGLDHPQLTKAREIIDFYQSMEAKGKEFILGVQSVIRKGSVNIKDKYDVGVMSFIPQGYAKEIKRRLEEAEVKNEFFGELKSRGKLKLKLTQRFYHDGRFPTTRFKFVSDDNQRFELVSSEGREPDIEVGKTYIMDGTIKEHSEYKGKKSTRIAIVKNIEEVEPSTPAPEFSTKKKPKRAVEKDDGLTM